MKRRSFIKGLIGAPIVASTASLALPIEEQPELFDPALFSVPFVNQYRVSEKDKLLIKNGGWF